MARLDDAETRAWRAFLSTQTRILPTLDAELTREMRMNLSQYEVLLWLNDADGNCLRMSDLATKVVLSPSGLTRAVDQLERRGFVERRVSDTDRRAYLATLTEQGKAQLRRASETHVRGIREHLTSKLSEHQLHQLASLLELISSEVAVPPCDVAS